MPPRLTPAQKRAQAKKKKNAAVDPETGLQLLPDYSTDPNQPTVSHPNRGKPKPERGKGNPKAGGKPPADYRSPDTREAAESPKPTTRRAVKPTTKRPPPPSIFDPFPALRAPEPPDPMKAQLKELRRRRARLEAFIKEKGHELNEQDYRSYQNLRHSYESAASKAERMAGPQVMFVGKPSEEYVRKYGVGWGDVRMDPGGGYVVYAANEKDYRKAKLTAMRAARAAANQPRFAPVSDEMAKKMDEEDARRRALSPSERRARDLELAMELWLKGDDTGAEAIRASARATRSGFDTVRPWLPGYVTGEWVRGERGFDWMTALDMALMPTLIAGPGEGLVAGGLRASVRPLAASRAALAGLWAARGGRAAAAQAAKTSFHGRGLINRGTRAALAPVGRGLTAVKATVRPIASARAANYAAQKAMAKQFFNDRATFLNLAAWEQRRLALVMQERGEMKVAMLTDRVTGGARPLQARRGLERELGFAGEPASRSAIGRGFDDYIDRNRNLLSKLTLGAVRDVEAEAGRRVGRYVKFRRQYDMRPAIALKSAQSRLKGAVDYTALRMIGENTLPEARVAYHIEQAALNPDNALFHEVQASLVQSASKWIREVNGKAELAENAPKRLKRMLALLQDSAEARESILRELGALSDNVIEGRINAPGAAIAGAKWVEREVLAQHKLLTSPHRAALREFIINAGIPEGQVDSFLRAVGDPAARAHVSLLRAQVERELQREIDNPSGDPARIAAIRRVLDNLDDEVDRHYKSFANLFYGQPEDVGVMVNDMMNAMGLPSFIDADAIAREILESGLKLPEHLRDPAVLAQRINLAWTYTHAGEALGGKDWYDRAAANVQRVTEYINEHPRIRAGKVSPVTEKQVAQIFAILSAQDNTVNNVTQVRKALTQWVEKKEVWAGRNPSMRSQEVERVLRGEDWDGRKRSSFYMNIIEDIDPEEYARLMAERGQSLEGDPVTVDMWIARIFGEEQPGSNYDAFERIFHRLAQESGWRPKEVQAAAWVGIKDEGIEAMRTKAIEQGKKIPPAYYLLKKAGAADAFEYGISKSFGQLTFEGMMTSPRADKAFSRVMGPSAGATLRRSLAPVERKTGYFVAHGAYETKIPTRKFNAAAIEGYKDAHYATLGDKDNYVGIWRNDDDGHTYLDISRWFRDRDEAMAYAKEQGQLSIADLKAINANDWDNAFPTTGLTPEAADEIKVALKGGPDTTTLIPHAIQLPEDLAALEAQRAEKAWNDLVQKVISQQGWRNNQLSREAAEDWLDANPTAFPGWEDIRANVQKTREKTYPEWARFDERRIGNRLTREDSLALSRRLTLDAIDETTDPEEIARLRASLQQTEDEIAALNKANEEERAFWNKVYEDEERLQGPYFADSEGKANWRPEEVQALRESDSVWGPPTLSREPDVTYFEAKAGLRDGDYIIKVVVPPDPSPLPPVTDEALNALLREADKQRDPLRKMTIGGWEDRREELRKALAQNQADFDKGERLAIEIRGQGWIDGNFPTWAAALDAVDQHKKMWDLGGAVWRDVQGGYRNIEKRVRPGLAASDDLVLGFLRPRGGMQFDLGLQPHAADIATVTHEWGHFMRFSNFRPKDLKALSKWTGVDIQQDMPAFANREEFLAWATSEEGKKYMAAEEKIARGFEVYVLSGGGKGLSDSDRNALKVLADHIEANYAVRGPHAKKAVYQTAGLREAWDDLPGPVRDVYDFFLTHEELAGGSFRYEEGAARAAPGEFYVPYKRGLPVSVRHPLRTAKAYIGFRRTLPEGRGAMGIGNIDPSLNHIFKADLLRSGKFDNSQIASASAQQLQKAANLNSIYHIRRALLATDRDGNYLLARVVPERSDDIAVKLNPRKNSGDELRKMHEYLGQMEAGEKVSIRDLSREDWSAFERLSQETFGGDLKGTGLGDKTRTMVELGDLQGRKARDVAQDLIDGVMDPVENVVWVPRRFLDQMDIFETPRAIRGDNIVGRGLGVTADVVNDYLKASLLYLNPHYYGMNLVGNAVMNLLHEGAWAPINLSRAFWLSHQMGEETAFIDFLMGHGLMSVAELRSLDGIAGGAKISGALGHLSSVVVDMIPRRMAFIHEARRAGYRDAAGIAELLNDPDALYHVVTKAKRAMVDFDELSPFERDVLRRYIFVYPWLKGATMWTIRFPKEHPIQTAALMWAYERQQDLANEKIGPRPTYLDLVLPIGTAERYGEKYPLVMNMRQVFTASTPYEIAQNLERFVTGNPNGEALSEMLQPWYGNVLTSITGWDPFRHQEVPRGLPTLLKSLNPTNAPGWQAVQRVLRSEEERRADAEAGRLYPRNRLDDIIQLGFGSVGWTPVNPETARERAQIGPKSAEQKLIDWAEDVKKTTGKDPDPAMMAIQATKIRYDEISNDLPREHTDYDLTKARLQVYIELNPEEEVNQERWEQQIDATDESNLKKWNAWLEKMLGWDEFSKYQAYLNKWDKYNKSLPGAKP